MMALDHPSNMQIVVRKLPSALQNPWRDRVVDIRRTRQQVATFKDLVNFVYSCAEAANDPIYGKAALSEKQSDQQKEDRRRQVVLKRSSFSTNVKGVGKVTNVDGAESKSCPLCNLNHDLEDCYAFLKKSVDDKKLFLMENKLCFGCFGNDHMVKGCLNKRKFHAILPVRESNKVIDTYTFYDNGSDGCFLTDTLREQLELSGNETTLRLGTMHGQSYVSSTVITKLTVTDLRDHNPIEIPKLHTREFIPVSHKQIPTPEFLANWKHLEEVSKEVQTYNPEIEIGLLIGSNCPVALEPQRIVPSDGEGPFAIQLRHGWTINGPIRVNNHIMIVILPP